MAIDPDQIEGITGLRIVELEFCFRVAWNALEFYRIPTPKDG